MTTIDPQSQNADHLRARFAAVVLARHPQHVLDLGCGHGQVLALLREGGVAGSGFEEDSACREQVAAAGFPLCEPNDVAPMTFDWVVIRHVLHHLDDPTAMLRAAWRATRTGIIVAEPWFDRTVPSQRTADDLDLWLKVQHRRAGRVHHPNIPPAGLLGLITQSAIANGTTAAPTLAWDQHVHLRFRPLDAAFAEADALAHGLPQDHADRRALQALKLRAASTGVSCNGSATVVASREPARRNRPRFGPRYGS